jgi:hypothetical protein
MTSQFRSRIIALVIASLAVECGRVVKTAVVLPAPSNRGSPPPPFQPIELATDVTDDALIDATCYRIPIRVTLKRAFDGRVAATCAMTNASPDDVMYRTCLGKPMLEVIAAWSDGRWKRIARSVYTGNCNHGIHMKRLVSGDTVKSEFTFEHWPKAIRIGAWIDPNTSEYHKTEGLAFGESLLPGAKDRCETLRGFVWSDAENVE